MGYRPRDRRYKIHGQREMLLNRRDAQNTLSVIT